MIPPLNLPLLLNLSYYGFNRGLPKTDGSRGDFQPQFTTDGLSTVTYCNLFIQYVCAGLGYLDFKGMDANEMTAFMMNPQNGWITVTDEIAQSHANAGVIVIAGHMKNDGHGHVCLILPGVLEKSSAFGKSVPKCANVGKDVFYGRKVSFAFRPEEAPQYFALAGMIA